MTGEGEFYAVKLHRYIRFNNQNRTVHSLLTSRQRFHCHDDLSTSIKQFSYSASGGTFVMNKNSLNHPEDNLTSIGFSSNSTYLNDSKTGAAAATEPRDLGWLLEDVNITFYKSLSSM